MRGLPNGRGGQALAVVLLVAVLALAWAGGAAPALAWYADRADYLVQQQTLAARMQAIAATAPPLQRQLAQADTAPPPARSLVDGATDAIAGATLQQAVQDMAARAGATVSSAEVLPAETAGAYRRIGLRVTVSGGWPVVVALLRALAEGLPRTLVDDLSLRQSLALGQTDSHPLEASFTVIAFHAGQGAP